MDDNFDAGHPLYRKLAELAALTKRHGALRDGAQQHRFSSDGPGVYAFSRLDREHPHEYVVALNNSESTQTAAVPTYMSRGWFERVYGSGAGSLKSDSAGRLSVTVPALSAVVYRAKDHVARSKRAPDVSLRLPSGPASRPRRDRRRGRRRLVLRGHLPRARRPALEVDRHRRQRAVPRVPRHRRRAARDADRVQGRRPRQRRPHAHEPRPHADGRAAGHRARGAARRRPRARDRRGPRASPRRSTPTTSCASSARSTAGRSRRSGPTSRRRSTRCSTTPRSPARPGARDATAPCSPTRRAGR